jgi:hypothetical protein
MPCFERNVLLHDGTQQKNFCVLLECSWQMPYVISNHANFIPIIPCSRTGAGEGVLRGSLVPHALDALIGGRF